LPIREERTAFWSRRGSFVAVGAIAGGLAVAATVVVVATLVRQKHAVRLREVRASDRGTDGPLASSAAPEIPIRVTQAPAPSSGTTGGSAASPSSAPSSAGPPATQPASRPEVPPDGQSAEIEEQGAPRASKKVEAKPGRKTSGASPAVKQQKKVARKAPRAKAQRSADPTEADALLAQASSSKTPRKAEASPSADADDILAAGARVKPPAEGSRGSAPPRGSAAPGARLTVKPTPDEIRTAIRAVMGRIRACHQRHQQSGELRARITLRPNGAHDTAVLDPFSGTPTGYCVTAALEQAQFPRFSGPAFSFVYPFQLK
jgi:hypothetical protein